MGGEGPWRVEVGELRGRSAHLVVTELDLHKERREEVL